MKRKDIVKAIADELTLVFKDFGGRSWAPVNQEALILGTKANPVDGKEKTAVQRFVDALKGFLMSEDTSDDVDGDGDGARDYEDIASHLGQTYGDLTNASSISHEGARSAAIKQVLDHHMEWLDRKRAGADNEDEYHGWKAKYEELAEKAGARHSAEDKARLAAIEEAHGRLVKAHDKMGDAVEQIKQQIDGLGIHDTNEDNDGAQNREDEKENEQGGKPSRDDDSDGKRGPSAKADDWTPGALAEDGLPANYAEIAEKANSKKPYGDVKYADPTEGKYPIDTEEHIRAAWSYINMPKNYAKLGDRAAEVKSRIRAAMKKLGAEVDDQGSKAVEDAVTDAVATAEGILAAKAADFDEQLRVANEKIAAAELAKTVAEEALAAAQKAATEERSKLERSAELARKAKTSGSIEGRTLDGKRTDAQDGTVLDEKRRAAKALERNPDTGGTLTPQQSNIDRILKGLPTLAEEAEARRLSEAHT